MPPKSTATFSLDAIDQDHLKRLAEMTGWSKTQVIREALVALDRGLERYHARLRGQLGTRNDDGDWTFEPKPDDAQADLYRRVVAEMGYAAAVLKDVTFGHTVSGDPELTIDGYRYWLDDRENKLIAIRQVIAAAGEHLEMYEARQGGLRPRSRFPVAQPS